jgi:hypothetical protein
VFIPQPYENRGGEAKQKVEAQPAVDPFLLALSRIKGSIDIYNKPEVETIPTARLCDILGIPLSERSNR